MIMYGAMFYFKVAFDCTRLRVLKVDTLVVDEWNLSRVCCVGHLNVHYTVYEQNCVESLTFPKSVKI